MPSQKALRIGTTSPETCFDVWQMGDGWDLVREDYGEIEALARVPRDAFKGISIIPRLPPGQVCGCNEHLLFIAQYKPFSGRADALLKCCNIPMLCENCKAATLLAAGQIPELQLVGLDIVSIGPSTLCCAQTDERSRGLKTYCSRLGRTLLWFTQQVLH